MVLSRKQLLLLETEKNSSDEGANSFADFGQGNTMLK